MIRLFAFVILSVAVAVASAPAHAQLREPAGSGRLSAVTSGAPVPTGAAIEVLSGAPDDRLGGDPLHRAVGAALAESLGARGFRPGGTPRLTLRYDVSSVQYGSGGGPLGPVGPGSPPGPRPRAEVVDQFRFPFDAAVDGAPPSLSVALVLYGAGGGVLWSATIRAAGRFPQPERTVALLARTALGAFGAAAERSFELGCGSSAPDGLCLD
jgi:hypothetical protein